MPLIMIKRYSEVGYTQLQNKSKSGLQQEKGWELVALSNKIVLIYWFTPLK